MSKIADEIENKDLLKRLEDFGLNEKEARVYVALLPYRDIGSSKLIRATGLHGQFVYDALEKLQEKGLARHVIQNGRKKFSAQSPNRLLSLIEEKRLAAQSITKELQNRFAGKHEQDFEVYQGEEAFIAHQMDLLRRQPEGHELVVFATQTEKYMFTMDKYGMSDDYEKLRIEKKISVRYIGAEAQRTRLVDMDKNRPLWTCRILPKQATGTMSLDIWANNITIITYSDPMLSFTLTSKEVANGYREFFEAVWALSHK